MISHLKIASLLTLIVAVAAFAGGCSVSHTSSTHENLLGGTTHTDTTVVHENH